FIDTAEVYGQGRSESIVGELIKSTEQRVIVATKFMPYPWRVRKSSLRNALEGSLERLQLDAVDLYQIHWHMPPVAIETWMDAMYEAAQDGLIRAIGVSNYDRNQTETAYTKLTSEGMTLASNQVEYHLLDRKIEKNGLMDLCKERGIAIIAYSPLAQGLLTGKYTPDNPPQGVRGGRYPKKMLAQIQPIISELTRIGSAHDGKSPAQVAINWCMCKGTIPIPGARNARQAEQNVGALGWRLTNEEVNELDMISDKVLG
ncbi:MAG: aldo/keto reductase, partial [Anaerolineae bacterium]|nr:aldo/keto reductase [Anaerolineae bacterium]